MSISEQCRLLQVSRSSYYYTPRGESPENLEYMKRIDELYMDNPTWGSRQMRNRLRLDFPKKRINRKRVQRLMALMGIEAIYPKKNLSKRHPDHKIYPYLLRNLDINRPNMVRCTDVTYSVPGVHGEQGSSNEPRAYLKYIKKLKDLKNLCFLSGYADRKV